MCATDHFAVNTSIPTIMQLDTLIKDLVSTAPPSEIRRVNADLSTIVPRDGNSIVDREIAEYLEFQGHATESSICSKFLKEPETGKFIDYKAKQKFYYDFGKEKASDFESYKPEDRPSYYEDLVDLLDTYSKGHYPSKYQYNVTPLADKVQIFILSEKSEPSNFYSGRWKSTFTIEGSKIHAEIGTDIHYYEEGNVRLHYSDSFDENLTSVSAKAIAEIIRRTEDRLTLQIVQQFDELNKNHFKHLRRLLPVTKSKVNWGKAIGNYKLGSNVAERT